ncbi:MAG: hypothetical protein QME77_11190 [bacterium]|nr:hypothetical protein [bacterium]
MDQNLPFQQNLVAATLGVVLVRAPSNRLIHVLPLVPDILVTLSGIQPGEVRRVGV